MASRKGKEKVIDNAGNGKRKRGGSAVEKGKTGRKSKNPGVLQFFEDKAYRVEDDYEDSIDDSMFDLDDFVEEDFSSEIKSVSDAGKAQQPLFVPKEEELSEEELERMVAERYRPGAGFVKFTEDNYENKNSVDKCIYVAAAKDPKMWRVKCRVGREKYSTFCLMQKYVDLKTMGNELRIISACALDHVKGFIFIEADKQNDIYEACKGLSTIYSSKLAIVPDKEISRLFSIRNMPCRISKGAWTRVKNGRYKGDLAQVVCVNQKLMKATVKLIPRVDLKALAEKFGGGVSARMSAVPPQSLISQSELEEFRPLIQQRLDRDSNEKFDFLDGMKLKDGYLYKKISIDSLLSWGVMPTDDELLKFEPAKKAESADVEWLSELMGKIKKNEAEVIQNDKVGGKTGTSSSASSGINFEIQDLVFLGRDFGIVVGTEKSGDFKVMKHDSDGGPSVVTVKKTDMKSASFNSKLFFASDKHSNKVSVNDRARILDGPLKDREGTVKKIYKGVLFLYDDPDDFGDATNGYFCEKANICEKLSRPCDISTEECVGPAPPVSEDLSSSPKTPLSPDQSFQNRDNKSHSSRHDDAIFSVGQSLRIRVGPLKGYLCRVLAVRRGDITVKLDSLHKILTVKCDHLSEVGSRRNTAPGEGSEAHKPYNFLESGDGASDWISGKTVASEEEKWSTGESTERTSWSALPQSNSSLKESGSGDDAGKDHGGSSWETAPLDGWGGTNGGRSDAPKSGSTWGVSIDIPHASESEKGKSPMDVETGGWASAGGASSWKKPEGGLAKNKTKCDSSSWNTESGDRPEKSSDPPSWGQQAQQSADRPAWGQQSEKSANTSAWSQQSETTENDKEADIWTKGSSASGEEKCGWSERKSNGNDEGPSWPHRSSTSSWGSGKGGW